MKPARRPTTHLAKTQPYEEETTRPTISETLLVDCKNPQVTLKKQTVNLLSHHKTCLNLRHRAVESPQYLQPSHSASEIQY